MKKRGKPPLVPSRSLGGKPWSRKEETRLLELVRQGQDWIKIAAALNRTFLSVQSRFRTLRSSDVRASTIVAKKLTRAERRDNPAPDLTCGAVSKPGRQALNFVRNAIGLQPCETFAPPDENDLVVCAVIREVLLLRLRADTGWLRITISHIRAAEHGIGKAAFGSMIDALEKAALPTRTP